MRVCLALLLVLPVFAQTAAPAFEAAELKVNNSGATGSHCDLSNGRLYCYNLPLRFLIAEAWTMTGDDVIGPSWLDDVHVDIVAKSASAQTPDNDIRLMAQTLLRDRMRLVSHIEQREKSVYALELWKGQPKLEKSTPPAKPEDADCHSTRTPGNSRMTCAHMTMPMFAHELSDQIASYIEKRVVDQTGLEGVWNFSFDFTPAAALENNGGLSLFAALQSQLGLQLESKHLPVPVLVVDSMEKSPTEN